MYHVKLTGPCSVCVCQLLYHVKLTGPCSVCVCQLFLYVSGNLLVHTQFVFANCFCTNNVTYWSMLSFCLPIVSVCIMKLAGPCSVCVCQLFLYVSGNLLVHAQFVFANCFCTNNVTYWSMLSFCLPIVSVRSCNLLVHAQFVFANCFCMYQVTYWSMLSLCLPIVSVCIR